MDFDRGAGLHSLPARYGPRTALRIARISHAFMIAFLLLMGASANLHGVYYAGVAIAACLIAGEHALIRPDDLRRLNVAFFNLNVGVSTGLLLATAVDLLR